MDQKKRMDIQQTSTTNKTEGMSDTQHANKRLWWHRHQCYYIRSHVTHFSVKTSRCSRFGGISEIMIFREKYWIHWCTIQTHGRFYLPLNIRNILIFTSKAYLWIIDYYSAIDISVCTSSKRSRKYACSLVCALWFHSPHGSSLGVTVSAG